MKRQTHAVTATLICLLLVSGGAAADGFVPRVKALLTGKVTQPSKIRTVQPRLDAQAARCVACHGDDAQRPIEAIALTGHWQGGGLARDNHPVGVVYEQSVARDPLSYKPSAALPEDVILVGGQVTCISCHVAKSSAAQSQATGGPQSDENDCLATDELAGAHTKTGLCMSCHTL